MKRRKHLAGPRRRSRSIGAALELTNPPRMTQEENQDDCTLIKIRQKNLELAKLVDMLHDPAIKRVLLDATHKIYLEAKRGNDKIRGTE